MWSHCVSVPPAASLTGDNVPPTHDPTGISWNTIAAVHIAHISSYLRRKKRETELEAQKAWAWRPGGVERAQRGKRSRRD